MLKPMPPAGPLLDWLRAEAQAPFQEPRGDTGDQLALQWLAAAAKQDSRVPFAVEHLLREGDPRVCERILRVANLAEAPPALKSAVARALDPVTAAQLRATTTPSGHSLLGLAVRALRNPKDAQLSAAIVPVLHDIDDARDGWPSSVAIGLTVDANRFVDRLDDALQKMSPEDAAELSFILLQGDEPAIRTALQHAGGNPSTQARQQLGDAVHRELDTGDDARRRLTAMGVKLPARESGADRWSRYATDLRLAP
ncbi:MAG: hypothetical protein JWN44_1184 [Myxococcales bacterium]|nr:hypothetical protein [Myxococcales bacterium]